MEEEIHTNQPSISCYDCIIAGDVHHQHDHHNVQVNVHTYMNQPPAGEDGMHRDQHKPSAETTRRVQADSMSRMKRDVEMLQLQLPDVLPSDTKKDTSTGTAVASTITTEQLQFSANWKDHHEYEVHVNHRPQADSSELELNIGDIILVDESQTRGDDRVLGLKDKRVGWFRNNVAKKVPKASWTEVFIVGDKAGGYKLMKRAKELEEEYVRRFAECDAEKADAAAAEMVAFVRRNVATNGEEARLMGDQVFQDDPYVARAILRFIIAIDAYARCGDANGASCAQGIDLCCAALRDCGEALVERGLRRDVRTMVLPLLERCVAKIERIENADDATKARRQASCLTAVANAHGRVGDYDDEASAYERGIALMRDKIPASCAKHHIYGRMLHSIGVAHEMMAHHRLAAEFFAQAIEAKKSAEHWDSDAWGRESERESSIELSEEWRQRASDRASRKV